MTAPKKTYRNRYPERLIASRVEKAREDAELTVPQAAEIIGLTEWSWYKKVDETTPFKVEELGKFAEAVKAPTGWPFVDWVVGLALDRELAKRDPGTGS